MPRPQQPVDTIRIACDGTIFGHLYTNVFWCQVVATTRTVNDLAALIDAFALAYDSHLFGNTVGASGACSQFQGVWQTGAGTALATTRSHACTPLSGASIDDAGACGVVRWTIANRYRGGKPRTYMPGPVQSSVSNGSDMSSAWQSSTTTAANDFRNAVNAITTTNITSCTLGTVSWFTAGGSETHPPTYRTPPVFEPYIGAGCSPKLGSQRRRIHS